MPARITDRASAQHQPRGPDRRQRIEQGSKYARRRNAPVAADAEKIIEQVPGTCRRAPEQIRALAQRLPETAQQCGALLQADQGLLGIDLKMARKEGSVGSLEREVVDTPRLARVGGEAAGAKHVQTGD